MINKFGKKRDKSTHHWSIYSHEEVSLGTLVESRLILKRKSKRAKVKSSVQCEIKSRGFISEVKHLWLYTDTYVNNGEGGGG